jgi:hypothetical protein
MHVMEKISLQRRKLAVEPGQGLDRLFVLSGGRSAKESTDIIVLYQVIVSRWIHVR